MAEIKELWAAASELIGEAELKRRFRAWVTGVIRTARKAATMRGAGDTYAQDYESILNDLNERSGRRFQPTVEAKHSIRQLLKRGYLVQDFRRVHEVKCAQWLGNEKMEYSLRPSTLYRTSHFDEYLAEWHAVDKQRKELAAKRTMSRKRTEPNGEAQTAEIERRGLIEELLARKWYEHESWADFIRWTMRFPDAESQAAYPMPERVDKMRRAPMMMSKVLIGETPHWAEEEYAELKKGATDNE